MTDRAIKLQCPACQRHLKILRLNPSKAIVCPKCNSRFRIDAQQQVQLDSGRTGWFGPSANRAVLNDAGPTASQEIPAAFEDIDHLLTGDNSKGRLPLPGTAGSNRNVGNQTRDQDLGERWAREKSAMSKSDERLQRNGLGLLVLATGLAMLPFVGRHVDGLRLILPYLPVTATALAFVGSFMLARSLRRGNLAAVLFSGLPFLLIGLIGLGGYYYQSAMVVKNAIDELAQNNGLEGWNPAGDQKFEPNELDAINVELNRIDDNVAADLVLPRHDQPLVAEKKPVMAPAPDDRVDSGQVNGLSTEKTSDREPEPDQLVSETSGDSTIASELKSAVEISLNAEKFDRLRDRIASKITRGHVKHQTLVAPVELRERFVLSDVAGESTVYGVAYFLPDPIRGFDVAFSAEGTDRTLELIVPVIDQPEFGDSIVSIKAGAVLTGLNVNVHPEGIVGLQGLFAKAGGQQKSRSQWAGQNPGDSPTRSIEAAGRRIHGIVAYRNQLKVVGLALILQRQADVSN